MCVYMKFKYLELELWLKLTGAMPFMESIPSVEGISGSVITLILAKRCHVCVA